VRREISVLQPPAPPSPWISERDFQQLIVDLATTFGWEHYHTLHAPGSDAGWPDLVLARPPQLLFVELKARRGVLSWEQRAWGDTLAACRCDWRCWKPEDWQEVLDTLTAEVRDA